MAIAEKIDDQVALVLSLEEATVLLHLSFAGGNPNDARGLADNVAEALKDAGITPIREDDEPWYRTSNKYFKGSVDIQDGTLNLIQQHLARVAAGELEDEDIPF